MRSHSSILISRMIRAGLRVEHCRYRVVAAGIDNRDRIISIATNTPRLRSRGYHAEERIIYSSPRSLRCIVILRVNRKGELMPIDPCQNCYRIAASRGIKIEPIIESVSLQRRKPQ